MDIQTLILFCGIQTLGLLFILIRPKFRTFPNLMLKVVLFNAIIHYVYYYLFYAGVITYYNNLAYMIVPFACLAPLMIYYYAMSVLYGKLNFTKHSILHCIPIFLITIIFIFFLNSDQYKITWLLIGKAVGTSLYLVYPVLIVKMIANFYGISIFPFKVFSFNKKKTKLLKLLCIMLFVHSIILVVKMLGHFFWEEFDAVFDVVNVCFLMLLVYSFSYVIINEPKSIHLDGEREGLIGFKKYNKSKLTRAAAEKNANILNSIMHEQKPYLDCEFSLSIFSELSKIPNYEISETLNGLIGQSFNDYVNNYRVEEFKGFLAQEKYAKFTLLALAFEAGFKSKTTFNTSFKKITNQTPSEYKKSISL